MDFLERLSSRDRERFLAAATTVRLARGDYLIRRGERGGDVYRVVEGELEVIDSRQQPAVVLDVFGRGQMVGEMGFLQEQTRTADVRAADVSVCQRWERGGLMGVLESDPSFAAGFYKALAGLAVDRSRTITTTAMIGALAGGKGGGTEGAAAEAHALAVRLKDGLAEIEPFIRRDRTAAQQRLVALLHNFQNELESSFGGLHGADRAAAGAELARELHPYVMRSHLGELANDRVDGWVGDGWVVAHIASHRAQGDGPLGEMFDAWALDLPSSRSIRERRALAGELVTEALGTPPWRILCLGATAGSLLAAQLEPIGRAPGELICVEATREALSVVESDLSARPRSLKLRLVQDDVSEVCNGRPRVTYPPQSVVVVDGLLEYLPERVAVQLVRSVAQQLAPGGRAVFTAMAPAPDAMIFEFLLRWPMLRRPAIGLQSLLEAGGLTNVRVYEAGGAGLVGIGSRA